MAPGDMAALLYKNFSVYLSSTILSHCLIWKIPPAIQFQEENWLNPFKMSLSKQYHYEENNNSPLDEAIFYVLKGFSPSFLYFFPFSRAKIEERWNVLNFCIAYAPLYCKREKNVEVMYF